MPKVTTAMESFIQDSIPLDLDDSYDSVRTVYDYLYKTKMGTLIEIGLGLGQNVEAEDNRIGMSRQATAFAIKNVKYVWESQWL